MILQLIEQHGERYHAYGPAERLRQLGLTPAAVGRLQNGQRQRAARESAIPQEDVDATIALIVEHPDVGAGRARLTLINRQQALLSTTFINAARQEVATMAEQHYRRRHAQEKQLEEELRMRQQGRVPYQHIQAEHPHHIWAIDFVALRFLSFQLAVCVVYDVFSQAYLALHVGTGCDRELAANALETAIVQAGTRAAVFMRRDNGSAFVTTTFQHLLATSGITDEPIPPGMPWFNGSLESCNGPLKSAIKTCAMQTLPEQREAFREARREVNCAASLLQQTCDRTRTTLNARIARPKFGVPPQIVLDGQLQQAQKRTENFIQRKKQERRKRMDELLARPDRPPGTRTFIAKVRRAAGRMLASLTTDRLYVLNEVIHGRHQAVET